MPSGRLAISAAATTAKVASSLVRGSRRCRTESPAWKVSRRGVSPITANPPVADDRLSHLTRRRGFGQCRAAALQRPGELVDCREVDPGGRQAPPVVHQLAAALDLMGLTILQHVNATGLRRFDGICREPDDRGTSA